MADVWFRGSRAAARDLFRAIGAQCCLVADLFRDAASGPGIRGNRCTLVLNRRHDCGFPTLQYNSCFAVVALPGMGQLCCDAQFHNLAYESRFHSPMVAGLRLKPETGTEAQMLEEWSRMMGQKRILFPILL